MVIVRLVSGAKKVLVRMDFEDAKARTFYCIRNVIKKVCIEFIKEAV
jgi:hypothetical protein